MKTNTSKTSTHHTSPTPAQSEKSSSAFFGANETQHTPFFSVQPKLTIGQPNDKYEQEADAVADKVVSEQGQTAPSFFSPTSPPAVQTQEDEDNIQRKSIFESPSVMEAQSETDIQGKEATSTPSSNFESQLSASKGGGSPLPEDTRTQMESGIGADFSGVRVHTGSNAAQMNQDIGAQAFTHGSDVYFDEGKYDTESSGGQHLLAHELTHTVQQGAAENIQQKAENPMPATAPITALEITHRFLPTGEWRTYLDEQRKGKKTDVLVRIGNDYEGIIRVYRIKEPTETQAGEYQVYQNEYKRFLEAKGLPSLNFLKQAGITPGLVLNKFGKNRETTGFISVKAKGVQIGNVGAMVNAFNKNMDELGFLGLDKFSLKGIQIENKFENGRLLFSVGGLKTIVDGFLTAGAGIGIVGSQFTMDINANVNVRGVAEGEFNLKRLSTGNLEGRAEISADIANVESTLIVEYLDGVVTIQGTGEISSEKFSGSVSFLVTDTKRADETMRTELGVVQVEGDAQQPKKTKESSKTPRNQVLVGWGDVTARVTPWLEGTAKIGIDSKGHVTMVGKLVAPNEVELMEERGKKHTLFDTKIKAGYGIPYVGQAYLFAGVELFVNAGFGPLVLKGVELTGTYSTDPKILQSFAITGTLSINAFAILGLTASAGLGITLLGHDVEAGIDVTAAAGIRAYAEATPILEYVEKAGPQGGKVGEAWLKGHFEAAAQLFLMLAGEFYVELDSPWWSPAPDKRWPYPLGSVEYPIGDSLGIGGDIEYLIGSNQLPELNISPVEFNPEKFTKDLMADPPPGKGKGGKKDEAGKWEDGSKKGDIKGGSSSQKEGKGLEGKNKIDYTKLPDQERYMKALAEIGTLAERTKKSPITESVLNAKLKKIKRKYAIKTIKIKGKEDGAAFVYVKHKDQNNSNNRIKMRLMTEIERILLAKKAGIEFQQLLKIKAGESNAISESDAKAVAKTIQRKHSVVLERLSVVDGGTTWEFSADFGDNVKTWPGMRKVDGKNKDITSSEDKWWDIDEKFKDNDGDNHRLYFIGYGKDAQLMIASKPTTYNAFIENIHTNGDTVKEQAKITANEIAKKLDKETKNYAKGLTPNEQSVFYHQKRINITALLDKLSDPLAILMKDQKLNKGTYDDPIPIIWPKRGEVEGLYSLSPKTHRWKSRGMTPPDYIPKAPSNEKTKLEIPPTMWKSKFKEEIISQKDGENIRYIFLGIDSKNKMKEGNVIHRNKETNNRSESKKLINLLNNYNYEMEGYHMDHVLDLGFGGKDTVSNLWPLYSQMNTNFGNKVYNQIVSYQDENGKPRLGSPKYLKGKWFKVKYVGDL